MPARSNSYVRRSLDDLLDVRTKVSEAGRSKHASAPGHVWRGDEELVRMGVRLVCIDRQAKAGTNP